MSEVKREYKVCGWAWWTKNKGALQLGMADGNGKIDRELMFVIFAGDLDKVKQGQMRSARIYKRTRVGFSLHSSIKVQVFL